MRCSQSPSHQGAEAGSFLEHLYGSSGVGPDVLTLGEEAEWRCGVLEMQEMSWFSGCRFWMCLKN